MTRKRECNYKRWTIYSGYSDYKFSAFLPGESPSQMNQPEWEDDSLPALKEFIDCY